MFFIDIVGPHGARTVAVPIAELATVSEAALSDDSVVATGPFTLRFRYEPDAAAPATGSPFSRAGPTTLRDAVAVSKILRATEDPVEIEFIRALVEDAEPSAARAIYADWLEENGHPERAAYLRFSESIPADTTSEQAFQLRRLGRQIAGPWRAVVAPRSLPIERCSQRENECPRSWGALSRRTSVDDLRHCRSCNRYVRYLIELNPGTRDAVAANPVVIDSVAARVPGDLDPVRLPSRLGVIVGRRAPELASLASLVSPLAAQTAAQFFAACATLEAAAVAAFERLARELASLGAPEALRRRVLDAACDETRHTATMERLAGDAEIMWPGSTPAFVGRTLYSVARENAVEGCVREAYGASVAAFQAEHAVLAETREAMAIVAIEEEAHAALSRDIARWLEPQLSEIEQRALDRVRTQAISDLRAEIDIEPAPDVVQAAGYPTRAQATALHGRCFPAT